MLFRSEETVPVMYIGLNREELLEALSAYGDNPPLTELEQGFETIELTAFSKDRVAVCKYYKVKEPEGFCEHPFLRLDFIHVYIVDDGIECVQFYNALSGVAFCGVVHGNGQKSV